MQVWDFQAKERTRPLQQYARTFPKRGAFAGRANALHAVDAADGCVAAFATADGVATVFEPATGQVLFTLRNAHVPGGGRPVLQVPIGAAASGGGSVTAARLSPSGRLLATAGVDNAVKVWDAANEGELLAVFVGHDAPPRMLVWGPGERALVSGGCDAAPHTWLLPVVPADDTQ